MFVPSDYLPPEPEWVRDTVRDNPLALLTTNGDTEPWATHLPVVPADETLADGRGSTGLVGACLLGHMNRANPHWRSLSDGTRGLVVFTGAGAYVSPTWYAIEPAAPTWDFTAVHARVRIDPVPAGDETLKVVCETARRLEGRFGSGWDQKPSLDYFRQILAGVGAFRMSVIAAEGMYKLSQDKDRLTRERVCAGLVKRGRSEDATVAENIRQLPLLRGSVVGVGARSRRCMLPLLAGTCQAL